MVLARRPALRLPAGGTFLAIVVAVVAIGYWTGFRDRKVDEDVVVASAQAPQLATGSFSGKDGHAGSGTVTLIRRPDGSRVLTFTDFDVDPGVDVDVYLTPGDGSDVEDRIELGNLKGNIGDQQYAIPAGADIAKYGTVVLWCKPFTVRIATARLST